MDSTAYYEGRVPSSSANWVNLFSSPPNGLIITLVSKLLQQLFEELRKLQVERTAVAGYFCVCFKRAKSSQAATLHCEGSSAKHVPTGGNIMTTFI